MPLLADKRLLHRIVCKSIYFDNGYMTEIDSLYFSRKHKTVEK